MPTGKRKGDDPYVAWEDIIRTLNVTSDQIWIARRIIWPLIRKESAFVLSVDDETKGPKAGVRAPTYCIPFFASNDWYLANVEHTLWQHRDLLFLRHGQVNLKLRQRVYVELIKKEITAMRTSKNLQKENEEAHIAVTFASGDVHSIHVSKLCGGRNEARPRDAAMAALEEFAAGILTEQAEEGPTSIGTWLDKEQTQWMDITDDKGLRHHLEAQYETDKSGDGLSLEVGLEQPPPED